MLSVALTTDGQWVLSGSKDRGVQFWDPRTGDAQLMLQGHKNSGAYCFLSTNNCSMFDVYLLTYCSHFRRAQPSRPALRNRERGHACSYLEVGLES